MLSFLDRPVVRAGVYGGFGFVVFLLALGATFPDEQIKDIVTVQLERQLGGKYSVEVADLDVWWFTGVSLENVTIKERVDPADMPKLSQDELDAGMAEELPMKVTIPRISGRLGLIRSILSLGPGVEFEVELGGGTIDGYAALGSSSRDVHTEFDELDLRKTLALTAVTGMPFFGELSGEIDLEMDPKKPTVTGGTISLDGEKLTIGPATIKTDKFPPITYLEIPQTNFGTLDIKMVVNDDGAEPDPKKADATKAPKSGRRQMKIDTFKWAGRDIRGDLWGAFKLASRVEQTSADVEMRMQFDEAFVKKNSLGPFLNVAEIRKGKNKDWFGLRLYGTLKNIRFKGSPASATGPKEQLAATKDAP